MECAGTKPVAVRAGFRNIEPGTAECELSAGTSELGFDEGFWPRGKHAMQRANRLALSDSDIQ